MRDGFVVFEIEQNYTELNKIQIILYNLFLILYNYF